MPDYDCVLFGPVVNEMLGFLPLLFGARMDLVDLYGTFSKLCEGSKIT